MHYFWNQFLSIIFLFTFKHKCLSLENTNKKYEYNELVFPIKKRHESPAMTTKRIQTTPTPRNKTEKKKRKKAKRERERPTRYLNQLVFNKKYILCIVSLNINLPFHAWESQSHLGLIKRAQMPGFSVQKVQEHERGRGKKKPKMKIIK